MSNIEILETIKEFTINVEGFNENVKAKICKFISLDNEQEYNYYWFISHNYTPSINALGPYRPSKNYGRTIEEAEESLMFYVKNFTNINVVKNKNY